MRQEYIRQKKETDIRRLEKALPGPRFLEDCKYFKPGSGFKCKARDIGLNSYIECLQIDSRTCPFSLSYAHSYYCACTLRVFIAKQLEKHR
jgi:hypothetical protein